MKGRLRSCFQEGVVSVLNEGAAGALQRRVSALFDHTIVKVPVAATSGAVWLKSGAVGSGVVWDMKP